MVFLSGEPPDTRRLVLVVIEPTGVCRNIAMATDEPWSELLSPDAFQRHWLPAILTLKQHSEQPDQRH